MLVKELPTDINLTEIKIKLPERVLQEYKEYCGGEPEMYIAGPMMGDFFLSPHPKDHLDEEGKNRRVLYPMPVTVEPCDMLEWEVVETTK